MGSKFSSFAAVMLLFSLICSSSSIAAESGANKLKVGFYARTCPRAETLVRKAVFEAVSVNPGLAAGLIRMHFHDCFVRGCEASVLLDSVRGKPPAEKNSIVNDPSLRGFEVIDKAKALVEAACPGIVSCADVLAFAARDSALKVGNIGYNVPSGRRDGLVSRSSEVILNVPVPTFNATQLRDSFKAKGLSLDEMVTLSGAHSIGRAHCSNIASRLSGFKTTSRIDPSLNPAFGAFLKKKCPGRSSGNATVNNDIQTPNILDNGYYLNAKNQAVLFTSDQTLFDTPLTRNMVVKNAGFGAVWANKFAAAMVHMGTIEVLTGNQGQIRRNCHFVN